jgi:cbb3-type cytochrome oxidase maturation protein
MDVIYGLIPGMIVLGLIMVGVLFWAAKGGQFDDLEGDAHRILMDDDLRPEKPEQKNPSGEDEEDAPGSKPPAA